MTDAAVVGRILREYRQDNIAPASVRRLSGSVSGARVGYQLALPDGGTVLVRAFRCDEPLPAYLQGCGTASVTDWLLGRTATLEWLASRGYPAPRVVATRTGDPVGVAGIWLTLATTTVPGPPLSAGEEGLGLLGEALGGLHARWTSRAQARETRRGIRRRPSGTRFAASTRWQPCCPRTGVRCTGSFAGPCWPCRGRPCP